MLKEPYSVVCINIVIETVWQKGDGNIRAQLGKQNVEGVLICKWIFDGTCQHIQRSFSKIWQYFIQILQICKEKSTVEVCLYVKSDGLNIYSHLFFDIRSSVLNCCKCCTDRCVYKTKYLLYVDRKAHVAVNINNFFCIYIFSAHQLYMHPLSTKDSTLFSMQALYHRWDKIQHVAQSALQSCVCSLYAVASMCHHG